MRILLAGVLLGALAAAGCRQPAPTLHIPHSLPHGRAYHGAVLHEGSIVLVGGSSREGNLAAVDVFDTETGVWSRAPDLPTTRDFPAVGLLAGEVFVLGGLTHGREPCATVERLNLGSNTWETLTPLPTIRHRFAAVVLDDQLYAIGGYGITEQGAEDNVGHVNVFDAEAGTWSRVADLQTARHGHAAVAFEGRIWVLGGYGKSDGTYDRLDSVEIYDPETGAWSPGPNLPVARGFLAAAAQGGELWAIGGRWKTTPVESLKPGADAWVSRGEDPDTRQRFALVAVGAVLVALGCEDNMGACSAFDPATNTWRSSLGEE